MKVKQSEDTAIRVSVRDLQYNTIAGMDLRAAMQGKSRQEMLRELLEEEFKEERALIEQKLAEATR
jgi:plasmid stability protein